MSIHDLEHEPHLRSVTADSAEPLPEVADLAPGAGVADEPGLSVGDVPGWADHAQSSRSATTPLKSWVVCAISALAAGPWAILAALLGGQVTSPGLAYVVVGPLTEEVAKAAVPFAIVELRPWWFRSGGQILMACLMGGLVFAVIENLMYLPPWKGPHPQDLVTWRWTVCTALHAGCSLVTGLGIVRMWRGVWGSPPRPADSDAGVPLIATAAIIHGGYNLLVWLMPPV